MDQPTIDIATRLKEARLSAGLTQDELADQLGIPRPSLTNMEQGKRKIEINELLRLARILKQPLEWFLEEIQQDSGLEVLARTRGVEERDAAIIRATEFRVREYHELRKLIGLPRESSIPRMPSEVYSKSAAVEQGWEAARKVRTLLAMGEHPVALMCDVLMQQGVQVTLFHAPDSLMDGFAAPSRDLGDIVAVNTGRTRERMRFTAAHELGHLVMDTDSAGDILTSSMQDQASHIETRANAFAAEFLIPASSLERSLRQRGLDRRSIVIKHDDIEYLRGIHMVSFEAMTWRLKDLGYLTRDECLQYLDQASHDSLPKELPSSDVDPLEQMIRSHALQAYEQEKISEGKLSEYLRWDRYETRAFLKRNAPIHIGQGKDEGKTTQ